MTARKRTRGERSPDVIPCTVQVSRGGVSVQVEGVAMSQAAEVACYLLAALQQRQREHPELSRPSEVVQIGGYSPIEVTDDETLAKKVGF